VPTLRPLAVEQLQSRCGDLQRIELLQQRLEGNDLARRDSPHQHRPQFLPYCVLTILCAPLGAVEDDRYQAPSRELPQRRNFSRLGEHDYFHGLAPRCPLQLRGRHWRLVEDHSVRGSLHLAFGDVYRVVIVAIAEGSQGVTHLSQSCSAPSDDRRRWRIQIVEQPSQ
jgi:hypothetical protein